MRDGLLFLSNRFKNCDGDPSFPSSSSEVCDSAPPGFEELMDSLRKCVNYFDKVQFSSFLIERWAQVLLLLISPLLLVHGALCSHSDDFGLALCPVATLQIPLVFYVLLWVLFFCYAGISHYQYPRPSDFFCALQDSPEWKTLCQKVRNIKSPIDCSDLNTLPQSLMAFQTKYFEIKKNHSSAISRTTRITHVVECHHLPAWIFRVSGLKMQQVFYQQVAEQLSELFFECLPRDCIHIITDYLISAPSPKFGQ